MKELEDLKNKWSKQDFSHSFSKEDIKGFLQKKSTYSIKWIFYLSIVEFILYLSFPLLVPNYLVERRNKKNRKKVFFFMCQS